MLRKASNFLKRKIPGYRRLLRLPRQIVARNPFDGDSRPTRVRIFQWGRPTLPFPHPWNYDQPIPMLETYFFRAEEEQGPGSVQSIWNCAEPAIICRPYPMAGREFGC